MPIPRQKQTGDEIIMTLVTFLLPRDATRCDKCHASLLAAVPRQLGLHGPALRRVSKTWIYSIGIPFQI